MAATIDPLTGLLKRGMPIRGLPVTAPNYRALSPNPTFTPGTGDPLSGVGGYPAPPANSGFTGTQDLTFPGQTPDYGSLIANDPVYKQLQGDLSAQGVSDATSRDAAFQRAAINWGGVPDFQQAGQALGLNTDQLSAIFNPQVTQAAQNNKLSLQERMHDQYLQSLNALRVSLRQRGASRSGEAGFGQQQALNQFDQARYDAGQQLLDLLSGAQGSYANAERQRQQQLVAAQQEAAQRQAALNPAQPDETIHRTGTADSPFLWGLPPGVQAPNIWAGQPDRPSVKSLLNIKDLLRSVR